MESLLRKPVFPQLFSSRSTAHDEAKTSELGRFAARVREDLREISELLCKLSGEIGERPVGDLAADYPERIHAPLKRLESITADVQAYTQGNGDHGPLELVDAQKVVFDVRDKLGPPAGFVVEAARELPIFWTSRADLERVITHLVDNAIRHHDQEQGRVEVAVHTRGKSFLFSVSDDGPGIPTADRDRVQRLFEIGEPTSETGACRDGVGLAVVRRLVERQGGTVTIGTGDGGRGTTVEFEWSQG